MKNSAKCFFSILFILTFYSLAKGQICKENIAGENDRAVCAMETVTFREIKTSEITGVIFHNDKAFENAVVELYKISGDKIELIKKHITLKDGRFCFLNLPKGKYRLRTSTTEFAFKCTEIGVEIKGKTKRLISLPLEVGN